MPRPSLATGLSTPLAPVALLLALATSAASQQPLFTFVQISDSQPQSSDENQAFVDVLSTIAAAGQTGALLPYPVDLVLFAGDITWGNTRSEWVAAKQKLDAHLTANGIPFLAVPGNHDVDNSDTSLYEEFIADSDVWDAGSAAFTGHNGRARTTGWQGLRFIGVNNSNPGWNTIPSADVTAVAARVAAAAAAGENAFILCHHPHDDKDRMPLASVLPNTSLVGYLHGHTGSPHVTKGLAGVVNPVVWDVDTNATYRDRCLVYFQVFPTQLRAHVVVLDDNPANLPAGVLIQLAHPLTPSSEPGIGYADDFHSQARPAPTSTAPERKLWHRAGVWWGVLWSDAAGAWRVQRLDESSQTWVDTGPSVSSSSARSFDALAAGDALVLASNLPATPGQAANGSPAEIQRFTWSSALGRYALDAGYPAPINDARSPTLVLARDGTGTLWAGWTRAGAVLVAHTLGADSSWSAPITLASGLAAADTVALASFGGSVGALWSDSNAGTLAFARHLDGNPDTAWTSETASSGGALVGTRLDLVAADGRALAAVRASGGALNLLERSTSGAWNVHALADAADSLDSPLLVVDRAFSLLRLFATGPTLAGQSVSGGGAVYAKVSPLAAIDFPAGRGTPVVLDGAHPSALSPTSTRQSVDGSCALAVLGSVAQTERYWHAWDSLASRPLAPVAEFTAGPLAGAAPLLVDFTDLSNGAPTHWSWDFGDGATSTEQEPQHVYGEAGTFTVTLQAANGGGEDARTRTGYVVVSTPLPIQTLTAVADARVSEGSPTSNAGTASELRVKTQAGSSYQSFLRFDLSGLSGSVSSARLRLFCTDESSGAGSVYRIASTSWGETAINWTNKPSLPPTPLAVMGSVAAGAWIEQEIGPLEVGLVSLALAGGTTNSALYSSREGANPPQLVVTLAGNGGSPPMADFTATPRSGPAPLSVAFTDASTGAPTSWTWDFGDGSTSSARNPVHVYTQPGSYTVLLDVANANGLGSEQRLDYVTVTAPPPVRTFTPAADTLANEANKGKNYGTDPTLRVRVQTGGSYQTFLRFDLSSLTGSVVSAKLRLFCSDASPSGGRLHPVATTWTESGLNWNNKPALPASPLVTLGAVSAGAWTEVDVTAAVTGPGQVAFALEGVSSNTAIYSSREGAQPPQLVVETGGALPPQADFAASPSAGFAPLAVSFTDLSLAATAWQWDFGDGTGSSERNPSHVYLAPGSYSVTLTASNALGGDSLTRADLIGVSPPSPVQTFLPVADARPNEASPTATSGLVTVLRVRAEPGESYHSYLRFDLAGLTGSVVSAKLRLYSTDGSNVGGLVYPTSGSWSETTLTWSNKPAPTGPLVTSLGTVATGAWAEFDVTSVVSGPGTLNLVLQSTSSNSCYYSSREGTNPPQLVVSTTTP
jgi:PKD repeat protein/predicted MPP superfamily phosphohydrolase